jgi:hypothetical protein
MPFEPSDEEAIRRRRGILLLACEQLLLEKSESSSGDREWELEVLRRLRSSLMSQPERRMA